MNFSGFEFEFSAYDKCEALEIWSFRCSGYTVDDTCVIEAGIFVTKYVNECEEYEPICKIDENPVKHNKNPLFHKMFCNSFKNVDPAFLPLLEKVCLLHPSLVESQEKRSCRFTEWAFTAMGRVLHFLITKKEKDMDDEACDHLQRLWDEVKVFEFDLDWLESDVAEALDLRYYMQKAAKVKKAKEDVDALEIETKRLKLALIERETELECAKKDLVKAKEGFVERGLDLKLGYRDC